MYYYYKYRKYSIVNKLDRQQLDTVKKLGVHSSVASLDVPVKVVLVDIRDVVLKYSRNLPSLKFCSDCPERISFSSTSSISTGSLRSVLKRSCVKQDNYKLFIIIYIIYHC